MSAEHEITITIARLDCDDFASALEKIAERYSKAADNLRPGIKRDNMLARAMRLERQAKELRDAE